MMIKGTSPLGKLTRHVGSGASKQTSLLQAISPSQLNFYDYYRNRRIPRPVKFPDRKRGAVSEGETGSSGEVKHFYIYSST